MATSNIVCAFVLSSLFHFLLVPVFSHDVDVLQKCGFKAIYQLGDSLADTGNLITENPLSRYAWFPYGMNLSKPTGRCSNGLLIIDYIGKFPACLHDVSNCVCLEKTKPAKQIVALICIIMLIIKKI